VQLVAQLACTLYWWNPLAWLAARRLRVEREHACDDLVLGAGILPSSYAADLLAVARSVSPDAATGGAVCMVDLSWTEARLRRVLDPAANRRPPHARFGLLAGGATLACAVTLACTSAPSALPETSGPGPDAAAVAAPVTYCEDPRLFPEFAPEPYDVLAMEVTGGIDPALIESEVARHRGALEACYQRRLVSDPELAGIVVMHWNLSPGGGVSGQCFTHDTLGDPEVLACLNELVAQVRLPAPLDGSVDVSYPFRFGPGC
jgi:hypothetical protein